MIRFTVHFNFTYLTLFRLYTKDFVLNCKELYDTWLFALISLKKWSINISRLPHPYSFPLYAVEMERPAMDGCHAVEISSIGGTDGNYPHEFLSNRS